VSSAKTISTDLIEVSVSETFEIQTLASQWMQLEIGAKPAYFLSWGWVNTWLKLLPGTMSPRLLTAKYKDEVVGLALLLKNTRSTKTILIPSKVLLVHETGDPHYDLIAVEYNDFLVKQEYRAEITAACLKHLSTQLSDWDEILISAVDSDSPLTDPELSRRYKLNLKPRQELPSWYTNLEEIRQTGKPYIDSLSSNSRYQIRRAIRDCEKHGDLQFSVARSKEEALDYLSRLSEWHRIYWNGKGNRGCFENTFLLNFHQTLIHDRFSHGEIQLVCLRAGAHELGYLYNFVKDGCVYFYQSGFNYDIGRKLKPGLIAHYKAIEHNMEQGMSVYNFLASDDRYKRSLSTNKHRLLWVSLQKNKLRFQLENALDGFIVNCKNTVKRVRKLYRRTN